MTYIILLTNRIFEVFTLLIWINSLLISLLLFGYVLVQYFKLEKKSKIEKIN
ncbi:MAG: hypothetical protein US62_C0045G0010 [Candidatus Woesebacteria bacterium GW2011_GWA1_37_8]|uniref:Uncharacterized protein n=1 Tax=Candidatus Woesebacteria bacterium GW2011_GWA1_37_8 TaxID=1618546 RepID=A0A0G0HKF6_9BACT|nr:MAG: hypothetical protein US62_C0045G0010 [Candidatus Woesebacteria bacterium GW2011_GWA1_37_8]